MDLGEKLTAVFELPGKLLPDDVTKLGVWRALSMDSEKQSSAIHF
jgi:hypothetical protein